MSDNIVKLATITKLDLDPDVVIGAALTAQMRDVLVIGFDTTGDFYFAGSSANAGTTILLLEMAKRSLLDLCP